MGRRPDQERIDHLTKARTQLVHERTPRSREWRERSLASLPLGVASSFQDSPPYPIFFERAKGSRVWDVDGNEYSDYHNGFGVMAVGHAHPKIVEALSERAAIGTHFAQPVAETTLLAEELCSRFRIDQMRFTNSGTEATMDAIRLARGVTGRDKIVKIEGSYHGHHESVLVSIRPSRDKMGPRETPASSRSRASASLKGTIRVRSVTARGVPLPNSTLAGVSRGPILSRLGRIETSTDSWWPW
jgi:glutamate-1-semialdehyde 2,1-aminomutase